jgi:hypothetical protein
MKRSWSTKILWMFAISLGALATPVRAQFAYVANQNSNVSGYTINGATGVADAHHRLPLCRGG